MVTIAALQRELAYQRAMNQRLSEANAAQMAQLVATNAELTAQIATLNERITELLAVAKRRQRPPAAAASPPPPPQVSADAQRAFAERPPPPKLPPKTKKAAAPRRPTGRKALPTHLEAETHELRPDACSHCGSSALDEAEQLTEEKLHVVKEHQRRRVVLRTTCRCRACGGRTTPRSLPAPYERSKVTSEWLAWLVYQKFVLLTPLDRIRRDLAERGVPVAMSTLVSFIERAADLLAPVDGLHWRQLLAGSWMATDGTGLKVLIPGLPAAHNGYLEIYRNLECAVFQYEPDKASGRKFRDAEATQPVLAAEGGAFLSAMYVEEEAARAQRLAGKKLLAHRRCRIGPILAAFKRWLAAVEPTLLPSEPLMAAVRYYRLHGEALFRFVEDPEVPIDNSPTEREFQNVAKLRLNMLFAGSTEGAHRACVLLGLVATCRAIGVPIQAYLAWAFDRLGTHRDLFALPLDQLTPAAFKRLG